MTTLYDPLTYDNLMAGLALHFQQRVRRPLATAAEDVEVKGPGIYALFYSGNFDAYAEIVGGACPINVGKAVPPGSRKGSGVDASQPALRRRLREHAKSIDATENLRVADFTCKHLAVVPVRRLEGDVELAGHERERVEQDLERAKRDTAKAKAEVRRLELRNRELEEQFESLPFRVQQHLYPPKPRP